MPAEKNTQYWQKEAKGLLDQSRVAYVFTLFQGAAGIIAPEFTGDNAAKYAGFVAFTGGIALTGRFYHKHLEALGRVENTVQIREDISPSLPRSILPTINPAA